MGKRILYIGKIIEGKRAVVISENKINKPIDER